MFMNTGIKLFGSEIEKIMLKTLKSMTDFSFESFANNDSEPLLQLTYLLLKGKDSLKD
jgi:hypothetical protein